MWRVGDVIEVLKVGEVGWRRFGMWIRAFAASVASLARGPHRLRHFPQREKRRGGEGEGSVFLADADGAGSVAELF